MRIDLAYQVLTASALLVLTILALACLIRCIIGPRISDRILSINVTGTLTVIMVCATVVLLGEGYLADIALIYSMISFLAVIVLSKVYTGIYYERKHEEELQAAQAAAKAQLCEAAEDAAQADADASAEAAADGEEGEQA